MLCRSAKSRPAHRVLFAALAVICLLITGALGAQAKRSNPVVKIDTNLGSITLELYEDKAPKTVANFLNYVNRGFYKNTVFHRVIPGFMIQGGGLTATLGMKAVDKPVENEADNGLKNDKYTVAMARTMDPHSASCQFFINVADNDFLNFQSKTQQGWGYTVFGKVIDGFDTVDKIAATPTATKGMYENVPKDAVVIEGATVVSE